VDARAQSRPVAVDFDRGDRHLRVERGLHGRSGSDERRHQAIAESLRDPPSACDHRTLLRGPDLPEEIQRHRVASLERPL
jgi:hypothetical protein